MDVTITADPNPAIGAALTGPGMRRACEERGHMALMLYQAQVAKLTGNLARSGHVSTEITDVYKGQPRWVSELRIGGPGAEYGLAHEDGRGDHPRSVHNLDRPSGLDTPLHPAHDLNAVLEQLHAF